MSELREYDARRELENLYEKAKKNIKAQIEVKGVSCKGSAKGAALSEIIEVLDKELEIGIAEELMTARRVIREYYNKYTDVESLERKIYENKEKLAEQQATAGMVALLTDEVLKNAILAYQAIKDSDNRRYGNREDAKEIAIAYVKSKGREDLKDVITEDKT